MNTYKRAEWTLRLGLGVMYLYSGYHLFFTPRIWTQFMPFWFRELLRPVITPEMFIKIQGPIEFLMALIFLAWFLKPQIVRVVALLSALEMAGILFLSFVPFNETNFLTTFRDIGVLGASLALWFLLKQSDGTNG